jgi:hypothetical protein
MGTPRQPEHGACARLDPLVFPPRPRRRSDRMRPVCISALIALQITGEAGFRRAKSDDDRPRTGEPLDVHVLPPRGETHLRDKVY